MKIHAHFPMIIAMYNRAVILVSAFCLMFSLVPDVMGHEFMALNPWMIGLAIIIAYPINNILLNKFRRIIVPLIFDMAIIAAFEIAIFRFLGADRTGSAPGFRIMCIILGLGILLSCISQFVWASNGLKDSVLKRHIMITAMLAASGILIMDEIGQTFEWLAEIIISVILALVATAVKNRVSVSNILAGFFLLGFTGLISFYLWEPAGKLIIGLIQGAKNILGPAIIFVLNIFHLKGKTYDTDYVSGGEAESIVSEAASSRIPGGEIMGWIVMGVLGLALITIVLFFLVYIMKLLLKKGLGITSPVILTGEKFSLKELLMRVRMIIRDFRAYLYLKKHNDSIAYLIVSLERKYIKDSELSRKSWETPMEFVKKIDFGGEDFRDFLAKNLYGSQKNLLATWNKK